MVIWPVNFVHRLCAEKNNALQFIAHTFSKQCYPPLWTCVLHETRSKIYRYFDATRAQSTVVLFSSFWSTPFLFSFARPWHFKRKPRVYMWCFPGLQKYLKCRRSPCHTLWITCDSVEGETRDLFILNYFAFYCFKTSNLVQRLYINAYWWVPFPPATLKTGAVSIIILKKY